MDIRVIALSLLCIIAAAVAGCTSGTFSPSPAATAVPTTSLAVPTPMNAMGCTADADCVPAQCCHPTGCINRVAQKPCDSAICTLSCVGPVDCGAGSCGCVRGTCSIVPAQPGPAVTKAASSLRLAAEPQRYSPLMSSTPGIGLSVNATGINTTTTGFTWTASYGRFLSWDSPDFKVNERGTTLTNHGEKVYWSFVEMPASTDTPVTVTVTAKDASGTIVGSSTVTLAWDGELAVRVQEIR